MDRQRKFCGALEKICSLCIKLIITSIVSSDARQYWFDYQLQWEQARYGGISAFRISSAKIWKPELVLLNMYKIENTVIVSAQRLFATLFVRTCCRADGRFESAYSSNAVLYSNGDVAHIPPAIYKSIIVL